MPAQSMDVTTFQNAMKDDYFKNLITSQLNDNQKLVSIFTKDTEGWPSGGNQLISSIKTGRNYAVRAVGDGGLLPSPKSPVYRKLTIPKRYCYGSVQFSGPVIKQSLKDSATFAKALQEGADDLVESIDRFRNRFLCSYGRGILALVNGAGTGIATLTVDTPGGFVSTVNGTRYLNEGMDVAIVDPTTGTIASFRTISTFDQTNQTVTFTQPVTAGDAPDNYAIVLASTDGTSVESSLDLEPMGLMGIVDDGTFVNNYFGVSRTTNISLRSTVIPTTGVLTAQKLQKGLDGCERKSGKMPNMYVMDHSVRREYLAIRETQFEYMDDKMKPDVGFDKGALNGEVKYTGQRIMPVSDMPYGYWVGLNTETMIRTVDGEGEWIAEDGAILSRIPNRDVFIANYRLFENYWSRMPNANFRLDGVTASIDVDHIF